MESPNERESPSKSDSPARLDKHERDYWQKQLPLGFRSHMERIARVVMRNQPNDLYGFLARHTEEQLVKRNELLPESASTANVTGKEFAVTGMYYDKGVYSPSKKFSTLEEDLGVQRESSSALKQPYEETNEDPSKVAEIVESGVGSENRADATCSDGRENTQAFSQNEMDACRNTAQCVMENIGSQVHWDESQALSHSDGNKSSGQQKSENSGAVEISTGSAYFDPIKTDGLAATRGVPSDIQPFTENCGSPINQLSRPEVKGNPVVSCNTMESAEEDMTALSTNDGQFKEKNKGNVTRQFSPPSSYGEELEIENNSPDSMDKKATGKWKHAVKKLLKHLKEYENTFPEMIQMTTSRADEYLGELQISPKFDSNGIMPNRYLDLEDKEVYDSVTPKENKDSLESFSRQQNADQSENESEDSMADCDREHSSSVDWIMCSPFSVTSVTRGANGTKTEGCDSHMLKVGSEYLFPFFSCDSGKLVFDESSVDGIDFLGGWMDHVKRQGEDRAVSSGYQNTVQDGLSKKENLPAPIVRESGANILMSDVSRQDPCNKTTSADWSGLERRKKDQVINASDTDSSVDRNTPPSEILSELHKRVNSPEKFKTIPDNRNIEGIARSKNNHSLTADETENGDIEELLKPSVTKESNDSLSSETNEVSEGATNLKDTLGKPESQLICDHLSGMDRESVHYEEENDETKKKFEHNESQFNSSTKAVFNGKLYQENEIIFIKEELLATEEYRGFKKSTEVENFVCTGSDIAVNRDRLSDDKLERGVMAGFHTTENRERGENLLFPETAYISCPSDDEHLKDDARQQLQLLDTSRPVEIMPPTNNDVFESNAKVPTAKLFTVNTTETESAPDSRHWTALPMIDVTKEFTGKDFDGSSSQEVCLGTAESDDNEMLENDMVEKEDEQEKRVIDNSSLCVINSVVESDSVRLKNNVKEIKNLVTEYISKMEQVSNDVNFILKSSKGSSGNSEQSKLEAICDTGRTEPESRQSAHENLVRLTASEAKNVLCQIVNEFTGGQKGQESEEEYFECLFHSRDKGIVLEISRVDGSCLFKAESRCKNSNVSFNPQMKCSEMGRGMESCKRKSIVNAKLSDICVLSGSRKGNVPIFSEEQITGEHPSENQSYSKLALAFDAMRTYSTQLATDANNNGLHQSRLRQSASAQVVFKRQELSNAKQLQDQRNSGNPQSKRCAANSQEKKPVRRISISRPHCDGNSVESDRRHKNLAGMKSNSSASEKEKGTSHSSITADVSAFTNGNDKRHGRKAGRAKTLSPSFAQNRPYVNCKTIKESVYVKENFPPFIHLADVSKANYWNHFDVYSSNKYGAPGHDHTKREVSSKRKETDALVNNTDKLDESDSGVYLSKTYSEYLNHQKEKGASPRNNAIGTQVNDLIRVTDFPLRLLACDTSKDKYAPEMIRRLSMEAPSDNILIQTVVNQTNSLPEEKELELSSRRLRWYPDEKLDFDDTEECHRKLVLEYDCLAFHKERGQPLNLENGTLWISQTHFPEAGEMTSESGDKGLVETLDANVPDQLRSICGEICKTACANAKLQGSHLVIDKETCLSRRTSTGRPARRPVTGRDTPFEYLGCMDKPAGNRLVGLVDTLNMIGWLRNKQGNEKYPEFNKNANYNTTSDTPERGGSVFAPETDASHKEQHPCHQCVKNSNNNSTDFRMIPADSDDGTLKEIEQITSETTTLGHVLRQPRSYENFFQGGSRPNADGQYNANRRKLHHNNGIMNRNKAQTNRARRHSPSIRRHDYDDKDGDGYSEDKSWRQLHACMSFEARPCEGGSGEKDETATQVKATDIGVVNVTQTGDSLQLMIPELPRRPSKRLKFIRPSRTLDHGFIKESLNENVSYMPKLTENGTQANQNEIYANHDAQTGSSLMYDGPACKWIHKSKASREEFKDTVNDVIKDNITETWDKQSQVVATDIEVDESIQTGLSDGDEKGAPHLSRPMKPSKYRDLDDCECPKGKVVREAETKVAEIETQSNPHDNIAMRGVPDREFANEANTFKLKGIDNYQPSRIKMSRTSSQKITNGNPLNVSITSTNRFDDSDGDTPKSVHEAGLKQSATTQVTPSEINVDDNAQTGSSLLQVPAFLKQPSSLHLVGKSFATDISEFETFPNPFSTETYQIDTEVDDSPPELPEKLPDDTQGDYNQWNCNYKIIVDSLPGKHAEGEFDGKINSSKMGLVKDTSANHLDSLARRRRRDSQTMTRDYAYASETMGDSLIDHVFPCDTLAKWNNVATNCRLKPQNTLGNPQTASIYGKLFYDCVGAMKMMSSTPRFDDDSVYTYSANQNLASKTTTKSALDIRTPSSEYKSSSFSRVPDEKASLRRYVERLTVSRNSKSVGVTWASDVPSRGPKFRNEGCQTSGEVQMAHDFGCCRRCRNGSNMKRAGTQTEITCSQRHKLPTSLEETFRNKCTQQPFLVKHRGRSMNFWAKDESSLENPRDSQSSFSENYSWDAPENTNMSKDNTKTRNHSVTSFERSRKTAARRQDVSSTSSDSMGRFVTPKKECVNQRIGQRKKKKDIDSAVANEQGDFELKLSEKVFKVGGQNSFQSTENSCGSNTFTKSSSACSVRRPTRSAKMNDDYHTSTSNEAETEAGAFDITPVTDFIKDRAKHISKENWVIKKVFARKPSKQVGKDKRASSQARTSSKTVTTNVKCTNNIQVSKFVNPKALACQTPKRQDDVKENKRRNATTTSTLSASNNKSQLRQPKPKEVCFQKSILKKTPKTKFASGYDATASVVTAGSCNRKPAVPKQAARSHFSDRASNVALSQRIGTEKYGGQSSRRRNTPTTTNINTERHVPYRKRHVSTNGPSMSIQSYVPQKPQKCTPNHCHLSPSTLACLRQVYGPAFAISNG